MGLCPGMNMMKNLIWWRCLASVWMALSVHSQVSEPIALGGIPGFNVRWEVLVDHASVPPGSTNMLALRIRSAPEWYTYWRQPSDSGEIGQAPTITWTLPPGVQVGDFAWPAPERKYDPTLRDTSYLYHGEVWLLAPLIVGAEVPVGPILLEGEVKWQECNADNCIPRKTKVRANVQVGSPVPAPADTLAGFEVARERLPRPADFAVDLRWLDPPSAKSRRWMVEFSKPSGGWDFFPYGNPDISLGDADASSVKELGGRIQITKTATKTGAEWPQSVRGLVVQLDGKGRPTAAWETVARAVSSTSAPGVAGVSGAKTAGPAPSFWAMLGAAFLGGLILNFMPCVLPVIALKILGFVRQSQESPARVRILGLAYGGGVLLSFLGLAVLVILAQAVKGWASWGMQFQDARFLVVMTTLVTLVAMNLFGIFEVHLGGSTMTAASGLARREGIGGAVANGVLATVLATPCTAPFLAPALGYAIPQKSAAIILLFFLMIGIGLAAPYVVLCWKPTWLKWLPKPGAWMEKFKMAMGFPMLATAVWLLTLTIPHFGEDGILWMGLFLVLVALAAWIYGDFVQRGSRRRWLAWSFVAAVLAIAYGFILEGQLEWRALKSPAATETAQGRRSVLSWEKWSSAAVATAQAAGHPVLVDFTARSCLLCQLNKKIAIEVPAVAAKIRTNNIVVLKADFTMEDPAILEELQRYGRSGVPLVLVYSRDPQAPPQVLAASLTQGMVLEALDKAL